ncbi:DNA polymerase subunit gamma-2, mitochondrial [Bradysia coprophila]|uniref:DNA polymerase subunit gamma-2, mitochondrial n=1 Tax=Bradysia coprophila TaxID=38358 RepID=UPI00187D797F|nr:DNA polymerase subunit gamma-2, mitochondrial [Bradysia coprophila]
MIRQPKSLQQIIEICQNAGFISGKVQNNWVKNVQFLPFGSLLSQNILNEWHNVDRNVNIYFQRDGSTRPGTADSLAYYRNRELHTKIDLIKKHFEFEIPFGVAENLIDTSTDETVAENDVGFDIQGKTLLSCSYFIDANESNEMFYKIQRQRKIWWMKFAANPGRFFISDLKTDSINEQAMQTVSVKSKFPFGNIELEKLELIPYRCFSPKLKFLDELKKITATTPNIIRSSMVLESGTLATLIDAVDTGTTTEINFHRKIAPYQCSIFVTVSDQSNQPELHDLAKYVASMLRRANISTLNAPKCFVTGTDALNEALREMDNIGVPYGLLLDEVSLKNGLIQLRNRDTTISETIHLSDVPDYLLKIFRS